MQLSTDILSRYRTIIFVYLLLYQFYDNLPAFFKALLQLKSLRTLPKQTFLILFSL